LLTEIIHWRSQFGNDTFLQTWESNLAFLGKQVRIVTDGLIGDRSDLIATGEIVGLQKDGALTLKNTQGETLVVHFGEIHDYHRQKTRIKVGNHDQGDSFHLRPNGMDSTR
jgi:biotin-(acetyl-CoA carboxylase) ligase